jgi:hypothetical protein
MEKDTTYVALDDSKRTTAGLLRPGEREPARTGGLAGHPLFTPWTGGQPPGPLRPTPVPGSWLLRPGSRGWAIFDDRTWGHSGAVDTRQPLDNWVRGVGSTTVGTHHPAMVAGPASRPSFAGISGSLMGAPSLNDGWRHQIGSCRFLMAAE